jgi:tetratricopeptide (TPR) repeat protein
MPKTPSTEEHPETLIANAEKLIQQGQPEKALAAMDRAIAIAPQTADVWQTKANMLSYLGRLDDALDVLDTALKKIGADANLLRAKAQFHQYRGEHDAANKTFDRLIELEPRSADGWLAKGWGLLSNGEAVAALDCASQAITLDEHSPDGYWLRGDCLLALKRWGEAFAAFSDAANRDPQQFDASNWIIRGDAFLDGEQHDHALQSYESAIKQDAHDPRGWYGKGCALKNLSDVEGALAAFARALEVDKTFIAADLEAGELYRERGDYDRALECFNRARAEEPEDPLPLRYIGDLRAERGQHDEARMAYESAIQLDPAHAETWNALGNSLYRLNRLDEAIHSFERSIDISQEWAWPHDGLSSVYVRQRRWDEAVKAANKAVDFDKEDAEFWAHRLWVLVEADRTEEIEFDAIPDHVLKEIRSNPDLGVRVASSLADCGRLASARDLMRAVGTPATEHAEQRLVRAECLLKIGETGEALDLIRNIDSKKLSGYMPMTWSFLALLADRLTGAPQLSDELMAVFIREYLQQMDRIEAALEWSFKGVLRLLARSELPLPEKFVLATLIDLQQAQIRHNDLSFLAEIWSTSRNAPRSIPWASTPAGPGIALPRVQ